jgi:hypothetical protein
VLSHPGVERSSTQSGQRHDQGPILNYDRPKAEIKEMIEDHGRQEVPLLEGILAFRDNCQHFTVSRTLRNRRWPIKSLRSYCPSRG